MDTIQIPFTYGLKEITELTPVGFCWDCDDGCCGTHYGLVARDTVPVIPEIHQFDSNLTYGLAYVELIPFIIKAIQELNVLVDMKADKPA